MGRSDSHLCCPASDSKIMYCWGGRNHTKGNVHRFDLIGNRWMPPLQAVNPEIQPQTRFYHGFLLHEQTLWIFGGVNEEEPNSNVVENELYSFDLVTCTWTHYEQLEGKPWPSARKGHCFVYRESTNSLLLYGGNESTLLSDIWEFDIEHREWQLIEQANSIPPRAYASGTLMQINGRETLVIFGGDFGVYDQELSDELFYFDLPTKKWRQVLATGTRPPPLFGHATSTCKISDKEIVVFGGCNNDYDPYGDCYLLSVDTEIWYKIDIQDIRPLNCTAICLDRERGRLHLLGGYEEGTRSNQHLYIDMNALFNYDIKRGFPKMFSMIGSSALSDIKIQFK